MLGVESVSLIMPTLVEWFDEGNIIHWYLWKLQCTNTMSACVGVFTHTPQYHSAAVTHIASAHRVRHDDTYCGTKQSFPWHPVVPGGG